MLGGGKSVQVGAGRPLELVKPGLQFPHRKRGWLQQKGFDFAPERQGSFLIEGKGRLDRGELRREVDLRHGHRVRLGALASLEEELALLQGVFTEL